MRDFKGLMVWQRAHRLMVNVYRATEAFPSRERFGLTDQIRRASISIPANIAEGCGRRSQRDLARFLQISVGSANELEYHLLLARELGYLETDSHSVFNTDPGEVRQMLSSLIRKVSKDSVASHE